MLFIKNAITSLINILVLAALSSKNSTDDEDLCLKAIKILLNKKLIFIVFSYFETIIPVQGNQEKKMSSILNNIVYCVVHCLTTVLTAQ